MANDRITRAAKAAGTKVFSSNEKSNVPGLDWEILEETESAIREIETNLRLAEQKSGKLVSS